MVKVVFNKSFMLTSSHTTKWGTDKTPLGQNPPGQKPHGQNPLGQNPIPLTLSQTTNLDSSKLKEFADNNFKI